MTLTIPYKMKKHLTFFFVRAFGIGGGSSLSSETFNKNITQSKVFENRGKMTISGFAGFIMQQED